MKLIRAGLAFALAALAVPALGASVPDIVAQGAQPVARPDPGMELPIAVVLELRHRGELARTLARLIDPGDAQFRHWLTAQEFVERFGPRTADYDAVRAALAAGGVTPEAALASRVEIDAHGRIADLERLLHVRFGLYRHPTENRLFLSPDREPSLDTAAPVMGVEGLTDFDRPRPRLVQAVERAGAGGSGPHGQFTAQDVRAAYYGHGGLTGAGQSVGVFELGSYNPVDVATYFDRVHAASSVPIVNVALNGIHDVCRGKCHDAEEALDIEEAVSMAPGLDRLVYYGGHVPISILARMASDDMCSVLSVSWGWHPNARLDEPVLQQMAVQGQTILVATGDDGYHLAQGAVWPADDAYAIAVGGTDLATDGPGGTWRAETGWRYSGGGPSPDAIALPDWQAPFVSIANRGSTTLRNVPDIAGDADTDNFSCYNLRCSGGNGGTSYAAPLWAGFVALANERAVSEGRPVVGFFPPALYGQSAAGAPLHDQVLGWNGRYRAGPGFDLVTGLGSPDGERTIRALVRPRR